MRIISMGRGRGKTSQMVEWLKKHETNGILIVHSEVEKTRILDQYFTPEEAQDFGDLIISFNQALTLRGRRQKIIGFDNLDIIMQNIVSPNQLGPVTVTESEI